MPDFILNPATPVMGYAVTVNDTETRTVWRGGEAFHVGSESFYDRQPASTAGVVFPSSIPTGARFFVDQAGRLFVTGFTENVFLKTDRLSPPHAAVATAADAPMMISAAVFCLNVGDVCVRVTAIQGPTQAGLRVAIDNPEEGARIEQAQKNQAEMTRIIAVAANLPTLEITSDYEVLVKRFQNFKKGPQEIMVGIAREWTIPVMIHPQSGRFILDNQRFPDEKDCVSIARQLPDVIRVDVRIVESIITFDPITREPMRHPGSLCVTSLNPAHNQLAQQIDHELRTTYSKRLGCGV